MMRKRMQIKSGMRKNLPFQAGMTSLCLLALLSGCVKSYQYQENLSSGPPREVPSAPRPSSGSEPTPSQPSTNTTPRGGVGERRNPHLPPLPNRGGATGAPVVLASRNLDATTLFWLREWVRSALKEIDLRQSRGEEISLDEVRRVVDTLTFYKVSESELSKPRRLPIESERNRRFDRLMASGSDIELFDFLLDYIAERGALPSELAEAYKPYLDKMGSQRLELARGALNMPGCVTDAAAISKAGQSHSTRNQVMGSRARPEKHPCETRLIAIYDAKAAGLLARLRSELVGFESTWKTYQEIPSFSTSVANAPFPKFLLGFGAYKGIWEEQWRTEFEKNYDKFVRNPSNEFIMDAFMGEIIKGAKFEDADLQKAAKQVGVDRAERILSQKPQELPSGEVRVICPLDPASLKKLEKRFGNLRELFLKLGFLFKTNTDCEMRQVAYVILSEQLDKEIRPNPEKWAALQKTFETEFMKIFPIEFENGFIQGLPQQLASIPDLITQKFKGQKDPLFWSDHTPIVEILNVSRSSNVAMMSMKDFTTGFRAEVALAQLLVTSKDPQLRGLAAPLFYSVINRILLFNGGEQLKIQDGAVLPKLEIADRIDLGALAPGVVPPAPELLKESFGGFGFLKDEWLGLKFGSWNLGDYLSQENALQLIPSVFEISRNEVPVINPTFPPVESLEDVADLLSAMSEFLLATRQGEPLAEFFLPPAPKGSTMEQELEFVSGQVSTILDPNQTGFIPDLGRQLGYGIVAALVKNSALNVNGHLDYANFRSNIATGGTPIRFYEKINLDGRVEGKTSSLSVAKTLEAVSEVVRLSNLDAAIPEVALQNLPEVRDAVHFGTTSFVGQAMEPSDGGYRDFLETPQPSGKKLRSTIGALHAITRAFQATRVPIMAIYLQNAWRYVDAQWQTALVPNLIQDQSVALKDLTMEDLSALQELVNLWRISQEIWQPMLDLTNDAQLKERLQHARWKERFDRMLGFLQAEMDARTKHLRL